MLYDGEVFKNNRDEGGFGKVEEEKISKGIWSKSKEINYGL